MSDDNKRILEALGAIKTEVAINGTKLTALEKVPERLEHVIGDVKGLKTQSRWLLRISGAIGVMLLGVVGDWFVGQGVSLHWPHVQPRHSACQVEKRYACGESIQLMTLATL